MDKNSWTHDAMITSLLRRRFDVIITLLHYVMLGFIADWIKCWPIYNASFQWRVITNISYK